MMPSVYPTIMAPDVTNNILRTLQSEVRIAQKQLESKLEDILVIRRNKYMNIAFYITLMGALALSSIIVLSDLWRVFTIHKIQSDFIKTQETQSRDNVLLSASGDDYEYTSPYTAQRNINKTTVHSLDAGDTNLRNSLQRAKAFRAHHGQDGAYYTSVGRNALVDTNDAYEYDPSKSGSSFWDELKNKPEVVSMLNNTPARLYPSL